MFQKFHAMTQKRDERGFTLIELLVVILIIAILAAIAIPVFLKQREKGWASQVESTLKNAATAEESYATSNDGAYTTSETALRAEGLRYSTTDVTFSVPGTAGSTSYCLKGVSIHKSSIVYWYDSTTGRAIGQTAQPSTCVNA
ncbi:MAG: prepilin-type N-terminal cleavage/methylation domain-containing protein [Actinomycetota bacterium]|nr:prepilin-type N-terminal cleavage/methylation domain-containing protein [Actinomycetota bacterium]